MKQFTKFISSTLLLILALPGYVSAQGFTDSHVLFYGEVRQIGGAGTILLQSGSLEMTFVNQLNPENVVTLETLLKPTGSGESKLYSYAMKVPLAYLPESPRIGEFLSINGQQTDFKIEGITINGQQATLPDGSKEFYGLSFASRASEYRLDLLVTGDSTDTDGDGMPDWWEKINGLNPAFADGHNDLDSDGWSNLEEFQRGSNPEFSNLAIQLVTAEIPVPELGETGIHLHFLDSDTPESEIYIIVSGLLNEGFDLKLGGVNLAPDEQLQVKLTDLNKGWLTLKHTDRSKSQLVLPLVYSDGGDAVSGQLMARVVYPSTSDGNDASLWLDGKELSMNAQAVGNWADRSGNGRNATQPVPENQPGISAHAADFSVSDTAHLFFKDTAFPVGNHTVLASYRTEQASDSAQTIFHTNRGYLKVTPTMQTESYPGAAVYQFDGMAVRGYENRMGSTVTSIFRREGSLLQNISGLSYDGENTAAGNINPSLPTIGLRRLAGGASISTDETFGGQLHELLVFPTALPEQKLRDVNDYLQSKWTGAVIWDKSNELKQIQISIDEGSSQRHILRGGHNRDYLQGGSLNDILSGGPGDDILSGGLGMDRFVFGGVDTGNDIIMDFDPSQDVVDLSALFWGVSGDARDYISVRLDADFSTPVPTLDSVLLIERPGLGVQEIVLKDTAIGAMELIQLIVEGHISMASLTVPTEVRLSLDISSGTANTLRESLDEPFVVIVTRSGEGVAAQLDVPLGFFEDALGGDLMLEGASSVNGRTAIISFARGETQKVLTFHPVPDLDSEGLENWKIAVLPHHKYAVAGDPVVQSVEDKSMVWLEVMQSIADAQSGQPAFVNIYRNGDVSKDLAVNLRLGGTASESVHIQSVAKSWVFQPGQSSITVPVTAIPEALARGPKVVHFQLLPTDSYQLGNPNDAILYAAISADQATGAGFENWLQRTTSGAITGMADMIGMQKDQARKYLQAYAFGLDSVDQLQFHQVSFHVDDNRPVFNPKSKMNAADIRWRVMSSSNLREWSDQSVDFVEVPDNHGLRLVGKELSDSESMRFFQMNVNLDPGMLVSEIFSGFAKGTNYGISGNASWKTDVETGELVSHGSAKGDISRIIIQVDGDETIDFEMGVIGGNGEDLFTFYIDGIKQAETAGPTVRIQKELTGPGSHLLMWEFKQGAGSALLRNL